MVAGRILELYREGGLWRVKTGIADYIRYWAKDNCSDLIGKFVELKGDRVSYHDVTLDLSSPVIGRKLKARFPLGLYEDAEVDLIKEQLPPAAPVVELGGGIGFISCFTDANIRDVEHIVIEANPKLIDVIKTNRELNGATFRIHHAAYQSSGVTTKFYMHKKFVGGSVQRETDDLVEVDGESLATIVDNFNQKITLIVDIEGGEFDLLDNELDVLASHCSHLFIEYHDFTDSNVSEYHERLLNAGFNLQDHRNNVRFYEATSN